MREGSLDAPVRHPIDWQDPDFTDPEKIDAELRRVFDICHGCRLCFNLCDSFPRLFDLIDESESGELDTVESTGFKSVVDACTLCDMCFMTKCPYVPPHEFQLDFPHLMLRYRAMEHKQKGAGFWEKQLTNTDRNGKVGCGMSGIANWSTKTSNGMTRGMMQSIAGVDKRAALPKFASTPLTKSKEKPAVATDAPAHGRKAVIYATCYGNYNTPEIGEALIGILAKNGVETEVVHPGCCGMPQMEQGDLAKVAENAASVAKELRPWVDKGYDVIALVPSCALMLKFEWPLIVKGDENVEMLSKASFDAAEYIVSIAKDEGLAEGLQPLDGAVTLHVACHSRAQNMGNKAAEMLRKIPDVDLKIIQRCSGHGGSWGVMKENYDVALKVGKPVARDAVKQESKYVASECPLAGLHILQGMDAFEEGKAPAKSPHPIELFAQAYGLRD